MNNRILKLNKRLVNLVKNNGCDHVTIIGSTKFKKYFLDAAAELESLGATVTHTHLFTHTDGYELTEEQQETALKNSQMRIKEAHAVYVICPDGYIGDSTAEEIKFATDWGIPIFYQPLIIGTHDGVFHADDLVCCTMISNWLKSKCPEKPVEIVRTRDIDILSQCDWIVDVGCKDLIDEENHQYWFDHHQLDSESYENGIKMAACGKVAAYLYGQNPELLDWLQKKTLFCVEAADNGLDPKKMGIEEADIFGNSFTWVNEYRPSIKDPSITMDDRFNDALKFANTLFSMIMEKYVSTDEKMAIVGAAINNREDVNSVETLFKPVGGGFEKKYGNSSKYVLVLDSFFPWQQVATDWNEKNPDDLILAVAFPSSANPEDGWKVQMVAKGMGTRETFISFPEDWRGQAVGTVNSNFIFCHPAGFISGWKTKEDAVAAVVTTVVYGNELVEDE